MRDLTQKCPAWIAILRMFAHNALLTKSQKCQPARILHAHAGKHHSRRHKHITMKVYYQYSPCLLRLPAWHGIFPPWILAHIHPG